MPTSFGNPSAALACALRFHASAMRGFTAMACNEIGAKRTLYTMYNVLYACSIHTLLLEALSNSTDVLMSTHG